MNEIHTNKRTNKRKKERKKERKIYSEEGIERFFFWNEKLTEKEKVIAREREKKRRGPTVNARREFEFVYYRVTVKSHSSYAKRLWIL